MTRGARTAGPAIRPLLTSQELLAPHARILVVEDQPIVAQVIAEMLEADGHEVETAANGRLALAKIEGRPYDLIISDLRIPELDGVGLYREVTRRQPALSQQVDVMVPPGPRR